LKFNKAYFYHISLKFQIFFAKKVKNNIFVYKNMDIVSSILLTAMRFGTLEP